ncbi:hypothetical protein KDW_55170 [Dictyobacter vulcani]|uniref:Uncharacterized protein n=1 Tax=Dictyobacter vulcani TaxID=2607529 RepID=A0A5J4KTX3_9CHLR|nr:hypothetical protein KDW_55170 [Dictyobacter vulcani]
MILKNEPENVSTIALMKGKNTMDRQSAHIALQQSGFTPRFVAAGMEGFVFDIGHEMKPIPLSI